jgi:F-type H+-transporting ATPase subunit delta
MLLSDINQLFQQYRARSEGAIEAELIAAMEVGDTQLKAIEASLSQRLGKKVTLTSRIDESLIGGAVIQAGDMVIDGSIRGQLDKLANTLVN